MTIYIDETTEYIEHIVQPIKQHYVAIHPTTFESKESIEMGYVTNSFKKIGSASLYSIKDIFEALAFGHCTILSNYEIDEHNNFRFVSSSIFAIDIDDVNGFTKPLEVLEALKDICCGLFYTFSHGKLSKVEPYAKMSRYRLVFQLDRSITDKDEFQSLIDYMVDYLKDMGLPADAAAKNPTQVVRPGNYGYESKSYSTMLKVDEWLPKAKKKSVDRLEKLKVKREERAKGLEKVLKNPVSFDELKQMCECIGYIPSGNGDENTRKWLQIVYALKYCVETNELDEIQGYELFAIISGDEANQRYWNSIKPYGHVDIGSIIFHAKNAGYINKNKYKQALVETLEVIPKEVVNVKGYLSTEIAIELIKRNQRLLVDSPTGSRKTSSFMGAFKELCNNENHFYIFASPTVPLTEQIAKEHKVSCIKGGIKRLESTVAQKVRNGERIFVCTFDKTSELIFYIKKCVNLNTDIKFTIVIDEYHHMVAAYNYRYIAIDQLNELTAVATSFIALSGTPTDILKDDFDKLIKIETGNNKSPCLDYRVFTYTTKTGEKYMNSKGRQVEVTDKNLSDIMLIPVIQGLLKQTRVLVFINNKERIKTINNILKKEGIRVQVVTSDNKKSSTYSNIVEHGLISEDVQVILSSTVIADGISINNDLNWSCLVVSDKASPIFNPAVIKQISNRFRAQYRYFCLYMREPNKDYASREPFYIETDYKFRKRYVENYVNYLNEEFIGQLLEEFTPSKIEKINGIFCDDSTDIPIITYNPLFVRHQSMKRKEQYLSIFRNAFIDLVGKQLGIKCSAIVNVNDEARAKRANMSGLLADIETEQIQKKKDNEELREAFSTYFDESIYGCFVRGDEEALKFFKQDVHPSQYRAMVKVCAIADFETCKQIGQNINKDADTHKYYNDIQSLVEIAALENTSKTSVTKRVYNQLLKLENETFTSSDFKNLIENILPRKLNVKQEDVKAALKLFHKFSNKKNGMALNTIKRLTLEIVAKVRHKKVSGDVSTFLSEQSIKDSILKYVNFTMKRSNKNILYAIAKYYGIY